MDSGILSVVWEMEGYYSTNFGLLNELGLYNIGNLSINRHICIDIFFSV